MDKTVKMRFGEDKYVDGKIAFHKDKDVDVAISSVDRWLKRGGILVDDPNEVEKLVEEDAIEKQKKSRRSK